MSWASADSTASQAARTSSLLRSMRVTASSRERRSVSVRVAGCAEAGCAEADAGEAARHAAARNKESFRIGM